MKDEAAHDPKYSTFVKRLTSFKKRKTKYSKGETDEQFCSRLGISLSKFRSWKYKSVEPDVISALVLADRLDVKLEWLIAGRGHEVEFLNGEGLRVTRIPREPLEIVEEIGAEEMATKKAKTS
ncbi:hypothetical protein [Desulfomonile tiedjei]|uniref:Bacteriophage CI repressor-like protein n=1 Tax=Desulfomonile tiedjei (strain ATCC 49306 / DSM 6799 / DCB-1) TaxID=706587 RepID=I4C8Y8_DESTA|nr:hypothetical protein [Desulfomonile tiedjei]AFM26029.1 bacteriophage CI repressor-like protein [Desulfomonile tiedjei DSM 6799]